MLKTRGGLILRNFGVTPLRPEVGGVVKHEVLCFTHILLKIVFGKVYVTFMYILATFDRFYCLKYVKKK